MAVASIVKHVPIYGHIIRLIGSQDASGAKLVTALTRDRQNIVLSPGGIAEMYTVNEKTENLLLKDRQGLLRIALQTGADVVPVYCFGNSETFKLVKASAVLQPLARTSKSRTNATWRRYGEFLTRTRGSMAGEKRSLLFTRRRKAFCVADGFLRLICVSTEFAGLAVLSCWE
uniref:LOC100127341 protein, related n=1 Tax=Neospora caninum (strain Liverpool) TaxID=572307 RepID=A0A0F7U4Y3_NEOCL|nr:TPA: LOC100127341 protein, related [Neospora caninum Liverpool]